MPRAEAADAAPPLPMQEDPLGQQPEKQTPEITVEVDVRDGHLTVRVVDIWGPGRTPLVYRTFTNSGSSPAYPEPPGALLNRWQYNHHLDIVGTEVLEPDGTRSPYVFSHDRWNTERTEKWQVYVKNVGFYATMEMHYTCETVDIGTSPAQAQAPVPAQPGPRLGMQTGVVVSGATVCTWDGTHVVYLPKGVVASYSGNKVASIRDANGNTKSFTYITFIDGGNRTYLNKFGDPIGRETAYTYERSVQICDKISTNPENYGECLLWNWLYRVKTATDPYGRTATFTYDANHRLASVTNGAGFTTTYTYDGNGFLASVTSARGHTTAIQWTFTPEGSAYRVTRVTAPDGAATTYAYTITRVDTGPYKVTRAVVTNARGFATTSDLYSGAVGNYFGNIERVTDALGTLTQYTYDSVHNLTQATNARGVITQYVHNSRNKPTQVVQDAGTGRLNLTTSLTWDGADNLLSVTNPRGIVTAFQYNATHNLTSVTKAQGTPAQAITQYTYTTWGGVASVLDPRGKTTTFTYDTRRRLTTVTPPAGGATTYGYDLLDNPTSMTNGTGRTWTYTYDTARNLLSETDPLALRTSYQYDAAGNRTRVTDPKAFATTFTYDNRDRISAITDPLTQVTSYLYDAVGNLTRITNARGYATNFAYDALNRLSSVTDALARATTYQYDGVGNRTQMTDRKGQVFTYTYDAVDRLTQVQVGTTTFSYTYDATGNRLTLTDGTGTTSFQYDQVDRLTRMTYPDTKAVIYAYDAAGNRTSLTNPANVAFTYAYDNANRLTQIAQGTRTWTFGYDAAGNRTSLVHPNGASIAYTYLTNNWLGTITHKRSGGTTFDTLTYAYDANGNRTTLTDATGTTTFGYDSLNRLTSAAYPGTYGTWSWTYDQVGNRLTQNSPSGQTNYGYDANNRLTSAGSATYAYDNNGNLISISTGTSFTYDAHNRMSQANLPGGLVAQYTYNGDGLKIRRIEGATTTRYYHDGIRPIYETKADGSRNADLERDIFGNLLARQDAGGTRTYYHHDGLGSTVGLTNASGAVAAQRSYDAWGNRRTSSGAAPGNYQFTGAESDPTSGLYHMGARFYDPAVGRWLSEEPSQDMAFEPAALNFYAYVFSNPLVFLDPDGKWGERAQSIPVFDTGPGGGGFGAVSGGGQGIGLRDLVVAVATAVAAIAVMVLQRGTQGSSSESGERKPKEKTPATNPESFERINVNGKPAFRNKDTGEVWVRDPSKHGGEHYEVYRNVKDAEKGKRHRAVWADGGLKENF